MISDLRYALRQLIKSPGSSLIAVLALALGIGANSAMFSIINSLFLRPLPYANPERLVQLRSSLPERQLNDVPFSWPRFLVVRDHQQVFSDLAVAAFNGFTLSGRDAPELVQGVMASANYLAVLGVRPLYGRYFSAEEDRAGGADVVLISYNFWQKRFLGSQAALGQPLTLDGRPHTIIGILPPALSRFPFNQTDLWAPRPVEVPFLVPAQIDNGAFTFQVIGRLKPGVTLKQARENVSLLAGSYRAKYPKNVDAPAQAAVDPLLESLVGNQRRTFVVLFGAVGCVLLIACANVVNLLLARFTGRSKEVAVRLALGASRSCVIRPFLLESLLVAVIGAALGLLFAQWSLQGFLQAGRDFIPRSLEVGIDPAVLAFTAGLALLTGLAMGIVPALRAASHDVNDALKASPRGSTRGVAESRFRLGLLIGEIALSLVLLVSASLLLTSFARLQGVAPGFQPAGLFVGFLNVPPSRYETKPELASFYHRVLERMAQLPGVRSVALNDALPLSGANTQAPIAVAGRDLPPLSERPLALRHLVSPRMFATLGIRLLAGRDFEDRDSPEAPHVVILNETMARQFFGRESPIGQKLVTGMGQIQSEVVGVVADNHSNDLTSPPVAEYFLPILQRPENFASLVLRVEGDPAAVASAARAALKEVDAGLPLLDPQTMTALIAQTSADRRLVMVLLTIFAGLAVVLASIGLYGVMAYMVGQRTGEFGIRMALGAGPGAMQRMVVMQGLKLAAAGILLGAIAALGLTRLLQSFLFDVQPFDPRIYAGISLLIGLVAVCACWIPARRAARIDPLVALRAE
ncbi:MAG TPA: ABC transporter permease [Candidatus Polarisedimenticolia bacterium]|jgi:putative ABC transport system permease protein|nr:ABC transporter permease [Candidatus Polarisedimenticolia bacterium]